MSLNNAFSSNASESGSLAFAPFFLSYPKRPSNMPKTKAFQRVLETQFASRRLIAMVPKVSAKKTSDCFITADNAAAFDRAASYKKSGSKPFSNVSLDGDGYIRLNDVLTVYPVSRAAWYEGIQKGIYPEAVKLGRRSVGWSRAAIRELIANPPKF
nr:AlpA family phage regulatory protein [uncultured Comamonas sp.]